MNRRRLGSVREVSRGVWRLQVSAGADPVTNRRRRIDHTVRGTRMDAERELARMLIEVGTVPTSRDMTVRRYLEDVWLPAMEPPKVRRRTHEGYADKLKNHVYPYVGHLKLQDLNGFMLDRWLADLARKKVGPHTCLHAYRVLHSAIAQAVKWRIITSDPFATVDAPKIPRHNPHVLTLAEANLLLDAFAGHPLEPVVVLALSAGLRRSEILGLTWAHVDFSSGVVTVERGLHRTHGESWIEPPKSETSDRKVTLPEWAVEALRPHRGIGSIVTMNPDVVSKAIKKHIEKAGLTAVPLRDLRHTHATLMLMEAGTNIVVVSRRLGHSGVAVTDQYYLRPGRSADADAAVRANTLRRAPTRAKSAAAPTRAK